MTAHRRPHLRYCGRRRRCSRRRGAVVRAVSPHAQGARVSAKQRFVMADRVWSREAACSRIRSARARPNRDLGGSAHSPGGVDGDMLMTTTASTAQFAIETIEYATNGFSDDTKLDEAFGAVYRGRSPMNSLNNPGGREVAIKVLKPELMQGAVRQRRVRCEERLGTGSASAPQAAPPSMMGAPPVSPSTTVATNKGRAVRTARLVGQQVRARPRSGARQTC